MYTVKITCRNNAEALKKALEPEIAKGDRFEASIGRKGDNLEIEVNAKDATALKAITTSMVKLIEISEKVWQRTKK